MTIIFDMAAVAVGRQLAAESDILLNDQEFLTILLANVDKTLDAPTVAAWLIGEFGSIRSTVTADFARLKSCPGMSARAAAVLKFQWQFGLRILKSEIPEKEDASSFFELREYLKLRLSGRIIEEFYVVYCNNRFVIIGDERMAYGTVDSCTIYPREIFKRALHLGASGIFIAHNHPSRRTEPSRDDIRLTNELVRMAEALDISVHDHLIVAGNICVSMRDLGLMSKNIKL